MEEKKLEKGNSNKNRKVVIGIRIYPDFKGVLFDEAKKIGVSPSEYGELILMNRNTASEEKENSTLEIQFIKEKFLKQVDQNSCLGLELKKEQELTKKLQEKIVALENEKRELSNFLQDPRLLLLYEKVKGRTDTIRSPDGQTIKVIYSSPQIVLQAMIYSYNYKQP